MSRSFVVAVPSSRINYSHIIVPDPLTPLPVITEPLTESGNWYVLVFCDYASCYLEATPISKLNRLASHRVVLQVHIQLAIAQTDGLVERFNQTLKAMFSKYHCEVEIN